MSWHFSRALVEESLAANSLDGKPCASSNMIPMHGIFWSPGKTTDVLKPARSGMTYAPSTGSLGEDVLTWCLAASPAKTYPPQEKAQESAANDLASGWKWHESSVKFDLASRSWKTRQSSLLGDLEPASETWPRWGMMRDGESWEQTPPVLLTSGNESGLWPTIRAADGERGGRGDLIQAVRGNPNSHYKMFPTPYGLSGNQGQGDGEFGKAIRQWPTPNQRDWKDTGATQGNRKSPNLGTVVHWPTPTASMVTMADMEQARYAGNKGANRPTYQEAKAMWATPTASTGGPEPEGKTGRKLVTQVGGQLNPTWVEWLMGWPLGWTDCAVSATDKFREWQRSHGKSLQR